MEVVTYMTIDRPIYDYSYRPIQKYLNWSLMLTLILGLFIFQISLILLNLSWCTKHQLSLHDNNILITECFNNVTNSCFKQKCKNYLYLREKWNCNVYRPTTQMLFLYRVTNEKKLYRNDLHAAHHHIFTGDPLILCKDGDTQ